MTRDMTHDSSPSAIPIIRVLDWQPTGVRRCIAALSRNFVGLMDDGCSVLKYPHHKTQNAMELLHEEAARYERLGLHDNLVVSKGIQENGLVFEYCTKGQLDELVQKHPRLTDTEKSTIGKQITRCLIYLHEHHFIHFDLNVNNAFITSTMIAKVGDIQVQPHRPDGSVKMPTKS